ncbi:MAG TPA: 1-(5-phosphoribosyl)-5-[(5-phosphoribosylamino)methylideneamino] imidazole-4-carboxamide isomerase [Gemmatimonadaceae bacterium]|nr:1-(5-phosphoribosyl)-5-[(5-phosphoribosylamino)methylideneamino] imidazole-4-carboxamide isomerase [Gemmatimonadaceae bacterium]
MRVIPALDIREGACVQLVGGDFSVERVRLDDPVAVARDWERLGFSTLHVVDLDAASAQGSNAELIREVISSTGSNVQVGGGVRDDAAVASLIEAGASAIIVGTRALQDPDWLAALSARYPQRIIVALDVRDGVPVVEAWRREAGVTFEQVMEFVELLPLAGILLTAVHREGSLEGPDVPLVEKAVRATPHPIIAAGGVSSVEDLRALQRAGAAATVMGMALYTGAIDPKTLTEEFVS